MNMVMKRDAPQVLGECAGLHPVDFMKKTCREHVNKYFYASQNMLFDASYQVVTLNIKTVHDRIISFGCDIM